MKKQLLKTNWIGILAVMALSLVMSVPAYGQVPEEEPNNVVSDSQIKTLNETTESFSGTKLSDGDSDIWFFKSSFSGVLGFPLLDYNDDLEIFPMIEVKESTVGFGENSALMSVNNEGKYAISKDNFYEIHVKFSAVGADERYTLEIDFQEVTTGSESSASPFTINLKAEAKTGEVVTSFDEQSAFGAVAGATDGYDAGVDKPAAPFANGLATQIHFEKTENFDNPFGTRFSTDMRGVAAFDAAIRTWFPIVTTTDVGTVSFTASIPAGLNTSVVFTEINASGEAIGDAVERTAGQTFEATFQGTGSEVIKYFKVDVGDLPETDPPSITATSSNLIGNTILVAGEKATFSFTLVDESGIKSAKLTITSDRDDTYAPINLTIDGTTGTAEWTPEAGRFKGHKILSFKVDATDNLDNVAVFTSSNAVVLASTEQEATLPSGWSIFGFPFTNGTTISKSDVFSNETPGSFYTRDWTGQTYAEVDAFTSGKGFWVAAAAQSTVSATGVIATSATETRSLAPGWHIVSTPYVLAATSSELKVGGANYADALGSVIVGPFVYGQVEEAVSMLPFNGYWLGLLGTENVDLTWSPSFSGITAAKSSDSPRIAEDEPTLLSMSATDAGGVTSQIKFGYHAEATDGYDPKYDKLTPPLPPSGIVISLQGPSTVLGNRYGQLVSNGQASSAPTLLIQGSASSNEITLNWEGGELNGAAKLKIGDQEIDLKVAGTTKVNKGDVVTVGLTPDLTSNENEIIPSAMELSQNFPNPFNPSTSINFAVPESGHVTLSVYNMLGQQVGVLVDNIVASGRHSVTFDASGLASGMYVYRLETQGQILMKKMSLIK